MENYKYILKRIMFHGGVRIHEVSPTELSHKPSPTKWSKKEIIGHLIDSAYNNHQRFLRAEEQGNLIFEGYDPDEWVRKNAYQDRDYGEILMLWTDANKHLGFLIDGLPEDLLNEETTQHNFHEIGMFPVKEGEPKSLSWLIGDYIYHLEYHLDQIIPDYEKLFIFPEEDVYEEWD